MKGMGCHGELEKAAWEESVRLRDRMFWARIGGGVVPAFVQSKHSPLRPSSSSTEQDAVVQKNQTAADSTEDVTIKRSSGDHPPIKEEEDVFHSNEKRVSIGRAVICVEPDLVAAKEVSETAVEDRPEEPLFSGKEEQAPRIPEAEAPLPAMDDAPHTDAAGGMSSDVVASQLSPAASSSTTGRSEHRLSITIPGAFE